MWSPRGIACSPKKKWNILHHGTYVWDNWSALNMCVYLYIHAHIDRHKIGLAQSGKLGRATHYKTQN